jgi:hypothetical protein
MDHPRWSDGMDSFFKLKLTFEWLIKESIIEKTYSPESLLESRCSSARRSPFTLSLSKGTSLSRSCFDKLSTNGLVFSVHTIMD